MKYFLIALMALALAFGAVCCDVSPSPVEPDIPELQSFDIKIVNSTPGIPFDVFRSDELIAGLTDFDAATLHEKYREAYVEVERCGEAFSTTMTPDEIRQHIAAQICAQFPWPPGCDERTPTCECYLYDHAAVYRVYPMEFIGNIGIHGIFLTQYTDAQIDALADALYWMGYGLPPNGPPMESPC